MLQSPRASLVLTVASRLPALIEQAEHLDAMAASLESEALKDGKSEDMVRRVGRWQDSANAGLEAAERLIATEPARSLAEAAVQVMLAVAKTQTLSVSSLTDDERQSVAEDLERLLQSALPVMAGAAGVDLADFGQTYYAGRQTDPFYRGGELAADGAGTGAASEPDEANLPADSAARLRAAGFGL
jgi:hypothetical protein